MGEGNDGESFYTRIQRSYFHHIVWHFNIYYHGYISWGFQYPYTSEIFASDLADKFQRVRVLFQQNIPFIRPLDYYLAVVGSALKGGGVMHSEKFAEKNFHKAHQNFLHDGSEIADIWPTRFLQKVDWTGETVFLVIPTFEIQRLVNATFNVEEYLGQEEWARNRISKPLLFSYEDLNQIEADAKVTNFKSFVNHERHGISGELFDLQQIVGSDYDRQNSLNSGNRKVYVYSMLQPKQIINLGKLLEGSIS